MPFWAKNRTHWIIVLYIRLLWCFNMFATVFPYVSNFCFFPFPIFKYIYILVWLTHVQVRFFFSWTYSLYQTSHGTSIDVPRDGHGATGPRAMASGGFSTGGRHALEESICMRSLGLALIAMDDLRFFLTPEKIWWWYGIHDICKNWEIIWSSNKGRFSPAVTPIFRQFIIM